jgi:hypothetical protein
MLAASHEEQTDSKRDSASANGSLFLTLQFVQAYRAS